MPSRVAVSTLSTVITLDTGIGQPHTKISLMIFAPTAVSFRGRTHTLVARISRTFSEVAIQLIESDDSSGLVFHQHDLFTGFPTNIPVLGLTKPDR
jgi:hypothetical protein